MQRLPTVLPPTNADDPLRRSAGGQSSVCLLLNLSFSGRFGPTFGASCCALNVTFRKGHKSVPATIVANPVPTPSAKFLVLSSSRRFLAPRWAPAVVILPGRP